VERGPLSIKYLAWVCALAVACTPATPVASPSSATPTPSPSPSATASASPAGLAAPPHAIFGPLRAWYVVPDGAFREDAHIAVTFPDADPTAGTPRARLRSNGRVVPLARSRDIPSSWQADLPLDGAPPGDQRIEILVGLRGGAEAVLATRDFKLSAPEYVVWTLDFEGDAAGDAEMANTAAISDGLKVPMTILWNPRAWTTSAVTASRADAMLAWTKDRLAKGDEVGLHLHMWTDYVLAAGVGHIAPGALTNPSWAGRGDGYDVPITAYAEADQKTLIDFGVKLMTDHALPKPTSFRAGGQFADAATLRAVVAAGFNADCSAVAAGTFGRLRLPWTLGADAQPYQPSREDANAVGDLPLLESPTIGGNTFGFTTQSIQPQIRANLSVFAPAGEVAKERRTINVVSHPGTIVPAERAAIEALLRAFDPLRYDRDTGPVRFVTLAQLARAYGR